MESVAAFPGLAFVDLETTGATAEPDRITEVGIVELAADGSLGYDGIVQRHAGLGRLVVVAEAEVARQERESAAWRAAVAFLWKFNRAAGDDFVRNGSWRPLLPGEAVQQKSVRFRTLGCYTLTGAVESEATTLPEIIQEMLLTRTSERQGRLIDHDQAGSMEKKKQEGYF